MPVTQDKAAPYAPPSAILDIVERYRNRGLPFPVNSEVLGRAGIAESLIPRTLQALQTLDLIKDTGNPTETLEGIRLAPEAEYKLRLEDWLKSAYADVFAFVDPAKDDESRIRDAFRSYQPIGQQGRMVTLFQGLCAAAGIISEKPSAPRAAPRVVARASLKPKPPAPTGRSGPRLRDLVAKPPSALPSPIAGLLEKLPPEGEGWTAAERGKFLATFEVVLDFSVPVITRKKGDDPE